ncbi:hypothetical protein ALC60_05651 [Trachymyrmex zeteki]|uniref:Uncharacterized protein n=1 Tax=Mycetomoellerius zeteki TaxID=64791 RepID=A0A151X4X5_9HYME|nr:hypothetical protein ALC60_05651 [Trachymyrmex zeteki]
MYIYITIFVALQIKYYSATDVELELLDKFEATIAEQDIESQALIYVAGYVAHRFQYKYPQLGYKTKTITPSDDWLSCISRGNCIYPTAEFLKAAEVTDAEFNKFHNNFFNLENKIFDKLSAIVCTKLQNTVPPEVIACLVRTRTYIRIRNINKKIAINNNSYKNITKKS